MKIRGEIYIPLILADAPGSGAVSRFLDSLPTRTTVKVPCVVNPQLAEMLKRRGFSAIQEYDKESQSWVEIYIRQAKL